MAGAAPSLAGRVSASATRFEGRVATSDSGVVKTTILIVSLTFFAVFIVLPLILVFVEAFRKGWQAYFSALVDPDALSAIRLTLLAAAIAVPLNLIFGVAAAWAIARFDFRGKQFLITLIDLPFSVSPVVAGIVYVLVFGLGNHEIEITSSPLARLPSPSYLSRQHKITGLTAMPRFHSSFDKVAAWGGLTAAIAVVAFIVLT